MHNMFFPAGSTTVFVESSLVRSINVYVVSIESLLKNPHEGSALPLWHVPNYKGNPIRCIPAISKVSDLEPSRISKYIWCMNTAYALPHVRPGSCWLLGSEPARIAMFEARILWSCRSATIWNWCRAVGWSMGRSCKTSSNGQSSRSTAPSGQGEEFCRMSSACNQSCL